MDAILIRIPSSFAIFKKPHYPPTSFSVSFCLHKNASRSRNCHKLASSRSDAVFDEAAFEADRLNLDARARESMAEEASRREAETDPKAWKWVIRKRVWDFMEAHNIAQNPRPVHHRIPNFVGAAAAAQKLAELEAFEAAKCVKVNPDSPQKQVRFLTLSDVGREKVFGSWPGTSAYWYDIFIAHDFWRWIIRLFWEDIALSRVLFFAWDCVVGERHQHWIMHKRKGSQY